MRSSVDVGVGVGVCVCCWRETDGGGEERWVTGEIGVESGEREGGRKSVESRVVEVVERVLGWSPGEAFEFDGLVLSVVVGSET